MKLSGQTRLSRSSMKAKEGKPNTERTESSRVRYEDNARDETFRYHDNRQVADSRRECEDSRDSEGSSSDGSLDEQITFLSESDAPVQQTTSKKSKSWRKKKFKGFPIIATIKKKIRRKKNKRNERNMNHLEIVPDNDVSVHEEPEPTQWEQFMKSVAFPEKQLSNLYSNFVDYVSNHEKKEESTPVMEYDQFKKVVEERQQTKREPLITDKQWENFMDTIAFPEKSIPALFASSPATTSTPTNKNDNEGAVRALEMVENYSNDEAAQEEQKDPMRPVIVTMFKKTKFDALGMRPQHLYGRTGVYIVEIVEGSKADNTKLRTGMKILAINGKPCPESVEETINKLSKVQGYVSIKAVPESPHSVVKSSMDDIAFALKYLFTGGGNVEEEENKTSREASTSSYIGGDESTIGASTLQETVDETDGEEEDGYDDDTAASSIQSNQAPLPAKSSVAPAPVKYEGAPIPLKSKDLSPPPHASSKKNHVDYVELARQPGQHYELVFDIKKRRGEWVGLSLMRSNDWPGIYIETVDPRSKFAKTQLTQGMKLVEINGTPCPEDLRQAIYVIFDTDGTLELTVEDSDGLYCHEDGSAIDTLSHDDFRENYGGFLVQNLRLD